MATISVPSSNSIRVKMVVTNISKGIDPKTKDVYLLPSIAGERNPSYVLMSVARLISSASMIDIVNDLMEKVGSDKSLTLDDIHLIRKLCPKFFTREQAKVILNALEKDVERKKAQYQYPGIVFDPLDEAGKAEPKECGIHEKLSLYLKIWIRAEFRVRNKMLWEKYLSNKDYTYDAYLQDSIEMFSVLLSH